MDKLVSILIPVFNREKFIEETVRSAINQTYENIEIIIVDNKSTDRTWEIIQRLALQDSRIRIFQNKTNIGPVRNWKRCVEEARGDYGKILWSDDLIAHDFLEKTVPFLGNPDVGFVFTGTEIFEDSSNYKALHYFIGETGIYESEKFINGILMGMDYPFSPGCALFRMKDLKENILVNIPNKVGIDFSMEAIGNDLLIFLLTANRYKKFAFVSKKLSFFRSHMDSITVLSNKGKLALFYTLATAYFIENYRKDLIRKMNTNIWVKINKYKDIAKQYNLDKIENFYIYNNDYNIDWIFLTIKIWKKLFNKLFNQ